MSAFDETELLLAVYGQWGSHGAHADLLRDIMRKAGIEPDTLVDPVDGLPPYAVEAIRTEPSRLTACKMAREVAPMGLGDALRLVDSIRAREP